MKTGKILIVLAVTFVALFAFITYAPAAAEKNFEIQIPAPIEEMQKQSYRTLPYGGCHI
ncbi:MAG: hypothetical protein ACYCXB_00435 [Candidatus Humimicrobiaceae bacterium]